MENCCLVAMQVISFICMFVIKEGFNYDLCKTSFSLLLYSKFVCVIFTYFNLIQNYFILMNYIALQMICVPHN